jgi:hypothetical protein
MLLAAVLLISACEGTSEAPPLSDDVLANTTYPLELAPGGSARFTNGEFASGQTRAMILEVRARGLIDQDAAEDVALVIAASGGGSGTFHSLVTVLNRNGEPDPIAWAPLGDRVPVQSVEVFDGRIVVRLREHGPGEPLCCPTVESTRTYELRNQSLELVMKTTP